jgi:hypothetical protein
MPLPRNNHPGMMHSRRPPPNVRHGTFQPAGVVDWMIVGLMLLAVTATFAIPSSLLTQLKIHYLTSGGNFYEKLHPATYATFLAGFLLLMRHGHPIGEINRAFSEAKLLLIYLFGWLALLIQMFVLERPFTVIIDTFLLPLVLALAIWRLSGSQRKPLIWAIHLTILINVVIGYYEYFSGHRLIPLTLGSIVVFGEWRSSALLGHPLGASGIVGGYVLALILRPALCPPPVLRLPLIGFCLASLMAFGGRTALVTVLVVIGVLGLAEAIRLMRGKRIPLIESIAIICLLFVAVAGIFTAYDLGFFDKMLLRFSSDKGSAMARVATFNLLSHFDWHELILGPAPMRVSALQSRLGLNYGIENFWVSCIVQFGAVHTALLTVGLICFFIEMLRRSSRAAWAMVLLIMMIAASSVSFSSKNIQLAQFVMLITLLLPREQPQVSRMQRDPRLTGFPADLPARARPVPT